VFTVEKLPTNISEWEKMVQAVATIEALLQLQDAWTYQTLIEMLEQNNIRMIVAYEQENKTMDHTVIGYCLYQVLFEQAEILRIGTHPDYQRQGIASQLFATLSRELMNSKVDSLLLEVRADNAPAIALYEQQKFTVIHKRKGYYQMPHQPAIDALIMQRFYR